MSTQPQRRQRGAYGALLKRWRDDAQLTQPELAARLGCSVTYIAKMEQGTRRPSMEMVVQTAILLHGDINEGLVAAAYPPIAAPAMAALRDTLARMNTWPAAKLQAALALLSALDEYDSTGPPISPPD
jgi:transcriptional regulator with XRE-family HTH domain